MADKFVVHNASDIVPDTWVVIDSHSGTAVIARDTEDEAVEDARIATAFYERWPSGIPTDGFTRLEGFDENGELIHKMRPLFAPGFWTDHTSSD
jgi:hypothetical protein